MLFCYLLPRFITLRVHRSNCFSSNRNVHCNFNSPHYNSLHSVDKKMSTEVDPPINPLQHLSNDDAANSAATTAGTGLVSQLTASVVASLETKLAEHASSTESHVIAQVNRILTDKTSGLTERAAKRFQEDTATELTTKGNKEQYLHNLSIVRAIDKAANAIVAGDSEAGLTALSEGKSIITRRQKLIRLADAEPYGWEFVREYTKGSLAADSDEEKTFARIRRTLKSNHAESARRPAPRAHSVGHANSTNPRSRESVDIRHRSPPRSHERQLDRRPHDSAPPRHQSNQSTSPNHHRPRTDFRNNRYDRHCYRCNRRGHMHFDCPEQ